MQRTTILAPTLLAALALLALGAVPASAAKAEVTITNLTYGQVLSPPVVASHAQAFDLFTPGNAASAGLAMLAQDGITAGLTGELAGEPEVFDIAVGSGMIPPGSSMTIEVDITGHHRWISLASMLVTTNDAFTAVRGLRAEHRLTVRYADAWDAGAEDNNEDCDFIPGPPCGNPGVGTATSEGFIHVHRGIHGIADLVAADTDWRNPVVAVSVRLIDESAPLEQ